MVPPLNDFFQNAVLLYERTQSAPDELHDALPVGELVLVIDVFPNPDLEHADRKAVDIALERHLITRGDLRLHVNRHSDLLEGDRRRLDEAPRRPKVRHLRFDRIVRVLPIHQDVVRLQIAVDNVVLVEVLNSTRDDMAEADSQKEVHRIDLHEFPQRPEAQ